MARYDRYMQAWSPEGGGRYDRFRSGAPRGEGWGARPSAEPRYPGGYDRGWSGPSYGQEYGLDRGEMQGRTRYGAAAGEPWGGPSPADRIRVADLMTRNPEVVTPDVPLVEVAARMRDLDVGIIPVVDNEDDFYLQGVVTDRDIVVRAAAEGRDLTQVRVGEVMTRGVEAVHENSHVRDVFSVMKRARVRRVPVTDGQGRLTGIVAQADLAVGYAGLDLQRETEVEEVLERISEPARPRWGRVPGGMPPRPRYMAGRRGYDERYGGEHDLGERLRYGWDRLRDEARHLMQGRNERGW